MTSLGPVGLKMNTSKMKILTTQAQSGSSLQTCSGATVHILDGQCAHKLFGCIFQAAQDGNRSVDIQIGPAFRTTRFLSKIALHFFLQS